MLPSHKDTIYNKACAGLDTDMRIILNLSVLRDSACDWQFF